MGSKNIDIVYDCNDLDRLEYFDEINRILIKEYTHDQHLKSTEVAFKLGELKEFSNHYPDKREAQII